MCILFIAIEQHPDYPLIIAANRDEFYQRATLASEFWPENTDLLAGKDLQAGGSWMGANTKGVIAALTNYRNPHNIIANAPSRGQLVTQALSLDLTTFTVMLQQQAHQYNGFNLLFGHWQNLKVFSSKNHRLESLIHGYYGLSNASLDTPWPKLRLGLAQLENYCRGTDKIVTEKLFKLLADQQKADDEQLPNTGVGKSMESALSSIFINLPHYGTRSSTLLLINKQRQLTWIERSFDENAQVSGEKEYQLVLN